jgi:ABC-2 type transport system ATP-binding protein
VAPADVDALAAKLRARFGLEGVRVDGTLRLEHARGHELVRDLVEAFPDDVHAITFGKPTLEDVFVRLTGRRLHDDGAR